MSRCIAHFFHEVLPREQAIRVRVEVRACRLCEDGTGARCDLNFCLPRNGQSLHGHFIVGQTAGNVHDVRVRLAGGQERILSVCIPEPRRSPGTMQPYVEKICRDLFLELKRLAGEVWLRRATRAAQRRRSPAPVLSENMLSESQVP